jgi:hypothetical protein
VNKRCRVITWDKDYNIHALLLEKRDKTALTVICACSSETGSATFSERLAKVHKELGGSLNDPLILGGFIANSLCFELEMPRLSQAETLNALNYEMPRHIPFEADENLLFFRHINRMDKAAQRARLRILSVRRKSWESLISELTASGIKADAVTHPFMAADPVIEGQSIYLETIDDEFVMSAAGANGMRQIEVRHQDTYADHIMALIPGSGEKPPEAFRPAILLGAYALTDNFHRDKPGLCRLPGIMMPQRYRFWKISSALLVITAVFLTLGIIFRIWNVNATRLDMVQQEKARVLRLIDKAKPLTASRQKQVGVIESVNKAISNGKDASKLLRELAVRLPPDMWLTNLKINEQAVWLTVDASGNTSNISTILNRIDGLTVKNLRKNTRRDGSSILHITMEELVRDQALPPHKVK